MEFGNFIRATRAGYKTGRQSEFIIDLFEAITHFDEKETSDTQITEETANKWVTSRDGYQDWIKRNGWTKKNSIDDNAFINFFMSRTLATWHEVQRKFKAMTKDKIMVDCETTNEIDFWRSVLNQFKVIVGVPLDIYKDGNFLAAISPITATPQQCEPKNIKITYADGCYVGEYMIDDRTGQAIPHGHGKRTWDDGSFYVGDFVRNERCGRGTYTRENGTVIRANWKDNIENGAIEVTNSLGVYFGSIKGEHVNFRKIVFKNGFTFEGIFTDAVVDGTLSHPDMGSGRLYCDNNHDPVLFADNEDMLRSMLKFPHLKGKKILFNDGRVYKGEIMDETPHGYGWYEFPNKMILDVKSDMGIVVDSQGIWTFPDNLFGIKTLECVLQDSLWVGSCVINGITAEFTLTSDGYISSVKAIYVDGSWEKLTKNAQDEYAKITYSNGAEYKGDWNWVSKSGYARGVFKDENGIVWDGEWIDGKRNGSFKVTYPDGGISTSDYQNDTPIGRCAMNYPTGASFEFEWRNGKFTSGHIKITYPDKSVYEGDFNGLPNGNGILTLADGTTYSGEWENGRFDANGICVDLSKMW